MNVIASWVAQSPTIMAMAESPEAHLIELELRLQVSTTRKIQPQWPNYSAKTSGSLEPLAVYGTEPRSLQNSQPVAVPHKADGLGLALKNAQGRYASYWNASHHSTGHV